ncbi:MAG: glycoside hydrolase family 3 protein, partial [Candidatus Eisenbacteria bacterium]|nr:glycoside hydrolase family 3 protein [Candidatus Eisenbacteria bacterium]
GFEWDFAPVADVHSEPLNPVIGPRAFGHDPAAVSAMVGAWLRGFRAEGLAACLKHFPGHGDTVLDSHLELPRCDADRATLEARELRPFRDHLSAAASIMTAHVVYPAFDAERPATYSPAIGRTLLRDTLGFGGVAITDALEMKGAARDLDAAERGRLAIEAGCDLLLFAFHDEAIRRARLMLANAVIDGGLDRPSFDAGRPRLAEFDRDHLEPSGLELERPLENLTPADWVPRLRAIIDRGLAVRGAWPSLAGDAALHVSEPEYPRCESLLARLRNAGMPLTDEPARATVRLVAVMTRVPVPAEEVARLRSLAAAQPLVLVSLQSDAVLDQVPEAALRIAASDATDLTRERVVARLLSERGGRA